MLVWVITGVKAEQPPKILQDRRRQDGTPWDPLQACAGATRGTVYLMLVFGAMVGEAEFEISMRDALGLH